MPGPIGSTIAVVGGGIVGLAVARELLQRFNGVSVTVFEKEPRLASHQSGHNSGVVHAGLYYRPGTLKARLCRDGGELLREYCQEHKVSFAETGKLVVAVDDSELAELSAIEERAVGNGVPGLCRMDPGAMREIEPHVAGVAALHSPRTAVVDYPGVCAALAAEVRAAGGEIRLGTRISAASISGHGVEVEAAGERLTFDNFIACAGLHSDMFARGMPGTADLQIVPFRGEYFKLSAAAANLVNSMIYPVPDPRYPFLGVHFTRDVTGQVSVGPNALLATALEGYHRWNVSPTDLWRMVRWPGTRQVVREHWRYGLSELIQSIFKQRYVHQARRYLPALDASALSPIEAGVRAQAVGRGGDLIDEFVIDRVGRAMVVRNAPSPAATSSLAIAAYLVDELVR
ncbi:MAG TPA: L-2-hydroxyglutarate oxidase [Jatrophihabitantaceae bacterium]|jgi:L-2-hydroxyglutarate oxidase|nr:L-2-hydroxyglutarate oxidase [Jatrophihabitantaceae bacterium]